MFTRKTHYGFYSMLFVAGAVTGAVVALMYAPTTGRKFQKQVKEVLDEQIDNVQNIVRKVVNT